MAIEVDEDAAERWVDGVTEAWDGGGVSERASERGRGAVGRRERGREHSGARFLL
jgi:hypothetical protein